MLAYSTSSCLYFLFLSLPAFSFVELILRVAIFFFKVMICTAQQFHILVGPQYVFVSQNYLLPCF